MVRALIVDDSALIRQILSKILSDDPEIEVVGVATDPLVAREKIKALNPDVITLDVEMPRMDGLAFLEKIMRLRPMPIVMVSTLTQKGADVTLKALEMGAVDFIGKPTLDVEQGWEQMKVELTTKVKAAAGAAVQSRGRSGPSAVKKVAPGPGFCGSKRIVAVGASTGGVEALREVICALPADGPPILIAQHMPPSFTERFAERLNSLSAMSVMEAQDGRTVMPGHAYIAPGDKHLVLTRSGARFNCKLTDKELVNGHRPSVDVLFESVAAAAGQNTLGVMLTGMGKDGAKGMRKMRSSGAVTVCQDEASSLIYGMPKAAKAAGAVQHELPLSKIAGFIAENA